MQFNTDETDEENMALNNLAYDLVVKERQAFSERLRVALGAAGHENTNVTDLSRLYNYHCELKVSSHAIHKWLNGEAFPTQQRLKCLAEWLRCNSTWLRYGTGVRASVDGELRNEPDMVLLRDLTLLDAESKRLVRVLVASMLER